MKITPAVAASMLLLATTSMAATVEYQHPAVTIVAENESLESVLTALSKEMDLQVTSPLGLNPMINCDIQNQPIKQAFKNLLGELSYSLVWADDGEHLTGLVILTGDGEATIIADSETPAAVNKNNYTPPFAVATQQPDNASQSSATAAPARDFDDAPQRAEQEAQLATDRQEQEARMAEEEAAREAEMALVRQEEEVAHEAEMVEARARREADMQALADSLGLPPLRK
jgi:hypothetical protein